MRRVGLILMIIAGALATVGARAETDTAAITFTSTRDGNSEIYVMDADGGNVRRLTNHPATDVDPAWSPDGRRIAFASDRDGDYEIYVMDDDGGNVRQLTFTGASHIDRRPAWSPDAKEIVFDRPCLITGLHLDLYAVRLDAGSVRRLTNASCGGSGGGEASWAPQNQIVMQRFVGCCSWEIATLDPVTLAVVRLTSNGTTDIQPEWLPGGSAIIWTSDAAGNYDIWRMASNGSGQVRLTTSPASDVSPSVSCDGSAIVFASGRDGNSEIYVMSSSGANQTRLTDHPASDGSPDWRCLSNAAPVAVDDAYSVDEDASLFVAAPGVLANDTEPDGDPVAIELAALPVHGTIDLGADGSFTYVPDPDYNGADSFGYILTDLYGATGSASVNLEVVPVNDAPVAVPDEASTPQYQAVTIDVVANDVDVDNDTLVVIAVSDPAHGEVTFAGGTITYDPDPSFKGGDSFSYTISDGAGGIAEASVTITEAGCGEDGLDTLDGTPAEGGASRTIDQEAEPAAGDADRGAAQTLHEVNCAFVVPAEEALEG